MIVGLGSDIVEVERIEDALQRLGEKFARRILNDEEWAIWSDMSQKPHYLAKRFAVKEAAAKALGTGFRNGLTMQDIGTVNDELGKPVLVLSGVAEQRMEDLGARVAHVTISDEKHYAVATVILES